MTLRDKVAIVTGAGGPGCGRAIALRFAQEGASVIVTDVNEPAGRHTLELIQAAGGRGAFWRADLSNEHEIQTLVQFTESTFGRLDVLVNNASAPYHPEEPFEHWIETIQVDLLGPMLLTRHSLNLLRRRGGAVVNMASVSALHHGVKHAEVPAFDAAKAGLIRLTTTLGRLQSEGIRVNCLAPGWIASPEVQAYVDSLDQAQRERRGVPKTLLTTTQIADAVVTLATDETLAGRVMVWWNDREPGLIPLGGAGYERLE